MNSDTVDSSDFLLCWFIILQVIQVLITLYFNCKWVGAGRLLALLSKQICLFVYKLGLFIRPKSIHM